MIKPLHCNDAGTGCDFQGLTRSFLGIFLPLLFLAYIFLIVLIVYNSIRRGPFLHQQGATHPPFPQLQTKSN